ncbi:hypothetical protein [Nonomuraea sp. NPDC052265]|uniref:hypothetical protein n=1 Tax=Nonomuraea sp. NPDC052265 TaxID=3364374 RepID=UPI0037CB1FBB
MAARAAVSVFSLVWWARSAHDLGTLRAPGGACAGARQVVAVLGGAGAVSAFTSEHSTFFGELWLYPESLYVERGAVVPYEGAQLLSPGISPLWYALALTVSGLILLFLYAAPPAHRVRHHVLLAGLASAVALCLLPAADMARGPVTGCDMPEPWEICPSATTVVQAAKAKQDQEIAAMQADSQAMCDATPRHRPRTKPARATRMKEPQWTDYGVLQTYEGEGEEETEPDMEPGNGLVSSARGILAVMTHPDFDLCVTLETYTRRPPVETKGWDKVVEVGHHSPGGQIVLYDSLSGTELPNLALNGRKGHYRIRVHYAWFPREGRGAEWAAAADHGVSRQGRQGDRPPEPEVT